MGEAAAGVADAGKEAARGAGVPERRPSVSGRRGFQLGTKIGKKFCQNVGGSFSAKLKPIFATRYPFCTNYQEL